MNIVVRKAEKTDSSSIAEMYSRCFEREKMHEIWVEANMNAFPRYAYYVAEQNAKPVGYACWVVKSGFRDRAVVELEQVGVLPQYSGKGIGKSLLLQSFEKFREHLMGLSIEVKAVYVTTREGNFAEDLYTKLFNIERQGVIKNYGSGDEVVLFGPCV